MNKRKTMILLCGFYITTFIGTVFSNAYMQPYLMRLGYDPIEIGVLTAGISFVAILSPIIVGFLCDKFKTVKKAFNVILIILTLAALLFYQTTEKVFFLHLIHYSLLGGLWTTMMTIQDTWAIGIDDFFKERYGTIRAFGAIGWMVGNLIGSWYIGRYGYDALGWALASLAIFNLVYTMFLPDIKRDSNVASARLRDLKELFKSREYVLIVLIFLFINMMSRADGLAIIDKMVRLGGGVEMIGLRNSLQAFAELPLFFAGAILLRKFGDFKLLMFGTVMLIIRFIGFSFVQTPELIIAVSLTQLCTFPLITIASRTLVDGASPDNLKSSGQTIAVAIYGGIPSFVAPILTGYLIKHQGTDNTLMAVTGFGVIALMLGVVYSRIKKKNV